MHSIGILGLGYIGLPLALAFAKKNKVYGFDVNLRRVNDLNKGIDFINYSNSSSLFGAIRTWNCLASRADARAPAIIPKFNIEVE